MTNDITEQENRLAMAIGAKYAEEFSSDIQTSRVADSFPLPFCYTSSGSAICFAKIIIENVALAENLNIEICDLDVNDHEIIKATTKKWDLETNQLYKAYSYDKNQAKKDY